MIFDVLKQKCAFKGIPVPTFASLAGATAELLGDWQAMLGHQLPLLPPFETYWNVLAEFFAWIEGTAALPTLATAPLGAEEEIFRPAVGLLRRQGVLGSSFLEIIRFAAVNRLCVDPGYQGSKRRIEPYSLRRTRAGDILLYAVRAASGESRSYRLDRVQSAEVTSQSFTPRFAVELTSSELGAIPPTTRGIAAARGLSTGRPRPRLGPSGVLTDQLTSTNAVGAASGSSTRPAILVSGPIRHRRDGLAPAAWGGSWIRNTDLASALRWKNAITTRPRRARQSAHERGPRSLAPRALPATSCLHAFLQLKLRRNTAAIHQEP